MNPPAPPRGGEESWVPGGARDAARARPRAPRSFVRSSEGKGVGGGGRARRTVSASPPKPPSRSHAPPAPSSPRRQAGGGGTRRGGAERKGAVRTGRGAPADDQERRARPCRAARSRGSRGRGEGSPEGRGKSEGSLSRFHPRAPSWSSAGRPRIAADDQARARVGKPRPRGRGGGGSLGEGVGGGWRAPTRQGFARPGGPDR